MHEQVADGELAGDVRIVHREPRQVVDHGGVPAELALLNQDAEGGGGKRLRIRRDAEERFVVDGSRIAQLADAVAFGEQYAAILHDGDREAGDLEIAHHAGDVRVEIAGHGSR